MKVIVAGSRTVCDYTLVARAIETSGFVITEVVSGGAGGPDTLGEHWAAEHSITVARFIPDWGRLGKRAGPLRNHEMAVYADALIAIWDGQSRGTKNMIDTMRALGKPFKVVVTGMSSSGRGNG